jgi:signal transduction histidine kinase
LDEILGLSNKEDSDEHLIAGSEFSTEKAGGFRRALLEETTTPTMVIREKPMRDYQPYGWTAEDDTGQIVPSNSREIHQEILNILKVLSHDIRGPLTTLGAGLVLLKRGAYGKMDRGVTEEIDVLLQVVKRLFGTAEDFLGRAFSVNGGLEMSHESLHVNRDIVQPVLRELSKEIQDNSVIIEDHLGALSDKTLIIEADIFWLKAIFRNLIGNAIKYGGKECRITIGFEDQGFQFRMNVHNTGKPVPEEFRDRLFTKFGRLSPKHKGNSEGMGLGLYLVREIIEKHGGHIWYEATHTGSNFVFSLPKI